MIGASMELPAQSDRTGKPSELLETNPSGWGPDMACPGLPEWSSHLLDLAYSAAFSPAILPVLMANPMVLPGRTKT